MEKPKIENLKALKKGRKLNLYQKTDAVIEFNKLLDYVQELEKCTISDFVRPSEKLKVFLEWQQNNYIKPYGTSVAEQLEDYKQSLIYTTNT